MIQPENTQTRKDEVRFRTSDIRRIVGKFLASNVLKTWNEDFIDESTGEVVTIERNEILFERGSYIDDDLAQQINFSIQAEEIKDGAEATYLSWQNAPESVKLEIDTLLRMIYTITQTPDISFDTVKGIGAVSGVALKLLFMDAHLKVQDKNEVFADYLQRRINVLKAFFAEANLDWKQAADHLIIEPKITPYIIEDELSKINILQAANGQRQIASRRATVQRLGWADDTDEELKEIETDEAKESSYQQGEPTF